MKLSKEDLLNKINVSELDDKIKIELMEDITDSFGEDNSEELENIKNELSELQGKYKSRFIEGAENKESKKDEDDEDVKKKNVIDVKEI